MDYSFVDEGLRKLGLELDIAPHELPLACREALGDATTTGLTVSRLVPAMMSALVERSHEFFAAGKNYGLSKKAKATVEIGWIPGAPLITERVVLPACDATLEDFYKLTYDDAMVEVAPLWDETFVTARYSHFITKQRGVIETSAASPSPLAGMPVVEIAKVMRWVFNAPPVPSRELCSVYVTVYDEGKKALTAIYLPVRGALFPMSSSGCGRGVARGRVMIPCYDKCTVTGDGKIVVEHVATAALGGYFPNWVMNYLARPAFFSGSREEADHLRDLFDPSTPSGKAFAAIKNKDGVSI